MKPGNNRDKEITPEPDVKNISLKRAFDDFIMQNFSHFDPGYDTKDTRKNLD